MNQFSFVLTQSNSFIIGPIAKIFGIIMNGIYEFFYNTLSIESLGISIIVFTILIRLLMLPLAVKQQKSMKDMQKVQPEIKKLQEKYKNKKDPESQRKMQIEMQKIYSEHGVSPFGGCLPLLIQFPIIIALFQVLRNIPAYISQVKNVYVGIVSHITSITGYESILNTINETKRVKDFDPTIDNKIIDLLSQFNSNDWVMFQEKFNSIQDKITPLIEKIGDMNYFLTINLSDNPVTLENGFRGIFTVGLLIPILCLVAQILVTKTSSSSALNNDDNGAQAQTQKTMMYTMPLITVIFVLQMPAGLGLYWLTSNVFQYFQQIILNKHLESLDNNENKKVTKNKILK